MPFPIALHPHDRIRSATTADLVAFHKDRGVRLSPLRDRSNWMVMDPAVVAESLGWRMFFFEAIAGYGGIASAVSPDGLRWRRDAMSLPHGAPGAELAATTPEPVRLPDGRVRMYYTGLGDDRRRRILSAISSDGVRFRSEAGVRVDAMPEWDRGAWSPCVLSLEDGDWRMYFDGQDGERFTVRSAISRDGLRFEIEPGARLAPGGPLDRMRARHARVARHGSSLRMLYVGSNWLHWRSRILSASSFDGLIWERDGGISIDVGGIWDTVGVFCPYLVRMGPVWRVYYGSFWGLHVFAKAWARFALAAIREGR